MQLAAKAADEELRKNNHDGQKKSKGKKKSDEAPEVVELRKAKETAAKVIMTQSTAMIY